MTVAWDITGSGRAWRKEEAMDRFFLAPHKVEMVGGKLFGTQGERETLLCLLLENVGADRVVQFGQPDVWKAAVAKLSNSHPPEADQ